MSAPSSTRWGAPRAGCILADVLKRKYRDEGTRCPRCGRLFKPRKPLRGDLDLPLCRCCEVELRQVDLPGMLVGGGT